MSIIELVVSIWIAIVMYEISKYYSYKFINKIKKIMKKYRLKKQDEFLRSLKKQEK